MLNIDRNEMLASADHDFDQGKYALALEKYECILAGNHSDIEGLSGKALSLFHLGKYGDSVPVLRQLVPVMPDSEQLALLLAESLILTDGQAEAESVLKTLLEHLPCSVAVLNRLGRMYYYKEHYPEANQYFGRAIELAPQNVEALSYMGMMLIRFCQFDNALVALQRAHAVEPRNVLVLNNLGRACKMMGRHSKALEWYDKALEVEPDNTVAVDNYLFALNYCHGLSPDFIAAEHFRLAKVHAKEVSHPLNSFVEPSDTCLRVGYLSGDLYTHSVAYFFEPILQSHNYGRFEVYCYSLGTNRDGTTDRLKSLPCKWRDMSGCSPEKVIEQVRCDMIDILVDLSGHTADNRLGVFAARSAPVQISWLGYPNTTGLANMDYYITDNACDPVGMTEHLYSEKLWRLPRVFSCYLPPVEFPVVAPSPFKANGYVTFGSFNNFAKVTSEQISLWARILRRVPRSLLYLKSMALGDNSVRRDVLSRFASEGVDADRIFMRVVTATPLEHLQEYGKVDIAFDTFPYHGTTTTCEALWMGTPVITLAGETHVSRVGVSLLQAVGCPELIAHTADEYVEKAVQLAFSPGRLERFRHELRGMMAVSPLMDWPGVTRELEEAFEVMFETVRRKRRDC
ncbi:MAG: tetratricopeptide repeat protein [Geobacteraceae bacterium]|nr:tetratricopeptide repeat protein [Geobacteraceae bacterium]